MQGDVFGRICIIGFGEVGQVLADELNGSTDASLQTYDLLFGEIDSGPTRAAASRRWVESCSSAGEAANGCDLIISAVTASQALVAAESVAGSLRQGTFYLDMNSVSPQSRRATAEAIDSAGGRFVEAAVMAPIEPHRIAVPILLGGPHAGEFAEQAASLGFSDARVFSAETGTASAVKMCRSVVIKGTEALLAESLAAARHYGVEHEVLTSLDNLLPNADWEGTAAYMIGRSLLHGERRAEEMQEVARTVAGAGLDPTMSGATGTGQAWAARFSDAAESNLASMLDALLSDSGEAT